METLHQQKLTHSRALAVSGGFTGYLRLYAITAISGDGAQVTFTAPGHGVQQYETFDVIGCAPSDYNGGWFADEVTTDTIKVTSELTVEATRLGRLASQIAHDPLARFTYPFGSPVFTERLPAPVLGLAVIPDGLYWACAFPAPGGETSGTYTLYVRMLRETALLWTRNVLMDATLALAEDGTATFTCHATWSAGGEGDYSLPLPEGVDEITRDDWMNDRAAPDAWLAIGTLALGGADVLEPCGVRDS